MKVSLLSLFIIVCISNECLTQSNAEVLKIFDEKAEKLGVEFFYPIETKIKQKKLRTDDFLNYDLVLKSKNDFEIRYFMYPESESSHISFHPHVEMTRTIATIATNDEDENIRMRTLSIEESIQRFNADWAIYADFVPKESFSRFRIGRLVSIYKEGRGYLNCIILYKKDNLDMFMGMPIRFKELEKLN